MRPTVPTTLPPDRWQRIEEIFLDALAQGAADRPAFLEQACAGDRELRTEVESMLAASDDGESLIESAVQGAFELAAEELTAEADRRRIGPYRVVRKLGEGGLSTVYLAERADEQFTMKAAVKVVKRGMETADILRRLRQERQILASLDHPSIARLFDGGTTGDGQPYFVMEYIEGEPIDEYCDRRQLATAERLELFRTACSAVHHAHQSLVIHRDIKPSNLLVTADGVPKLLDFGIAKLLDAELAPAGLAPQTLAHTAPGMQFLTPEYASPEQVRGEPLTTATDVYSLGVMLYRLLTGHPPYRFASARPAEIERVICDQQPEKPSTVIRRPDPDAESHRRGRGGAAKLRRRLAGDLDNIVFKAMRKEPGRRYASVEQLAEDVERTLTSRPVRARRDTFAYRSGKFVRRNRGAVAAAALVFLALVAGMATTTWQALIARDARARAERHLVEARTQSARAEQVSGFLVDLFEISDPGEARGNAVTAREILDQGAGKIRRDLSGQPELKAQLMSTMGRVYKNLGLYDRSGSLFAEALEERRRALGEEHPEVAKSLTEVARIDFEKGDYDTAEELLRQALAIERRLLGDQHPDVAATLHLLAWVLHARGDPEDAESLYREALAMRRLLLGEDHLEVADTLHGLAEVYLEGGRWEDAASLTRRAYELRREELGDEHPDTAESLNNLTAALRGSGDYQAAEPLFRQLLEVRRRIFGEEHPEVAIALNNLGTTLQDLGRDAEAVTLLRRALAINRELRGEEHRIVAANMSNLASSLRALGENREAEELYRGALAMKRRLFGDQHPTVTLSLYKLASFYAGAGRQGEAEPLLEETLRLQRRMLPAGDYRLSFPLLELARIRCDRGEGAAAAPLLREAVEIRRRAFPEDHRDRAAAEELLRSCGVEG